MAPSRVDEFAELSLTARLAIALHCLARFCHFRNLDNSAIAEFFDYLWEFPIIENPDRFVEWETIRPPLVNVGLGDEYPQGFEDHLRQKNVATDEFRELLCSVVEIVWSSFYGASDNKGALRYLHSVLDIVDRHHVAPPLVEQFASSRFADRGGWGEKLTAVERDIWRNDQPSKKEGS